MSLQPVTDIGVNLLHGQFDRDRDAVIERARNAGIARMLLTCTNLEESARGIEFCRARDRFWCTAGVHPHDAKDTRPGWLEQLTGLVRNPEVNRARVRWRPFWVASSVACALIEERLVTTEKLMDCYPP